MKNKNLLSSFLAVFLGVTVFILTTSGTEKDNDGKPETAKSEEVNVKTPEDFLSVMRLNEASNQVGPVDILKAGQEASQQMTKSGAEIGLEWSQRGPDNYAGRTRAILIDNQDGSGKTLFAGSVTGGIWKSTTGGLLWSNTDGSDFNEKVSCMTQTANGTIYVGTGESLPNGEGEEFEFIGSGIYKSTDGENFTRIESTNPEAADGKWAFVNNIDYDSNQDFLWAATWGGVQYSANDGGSWTTPKFYIDSLFHIVNASYDIQCDSIEVSGDDVTIYGADTTGMSVDTVNIDQIRVKDTLNGQAYDVKVSENGVVMANVDGLSFHYPGQGEIVFECISHDPENPYRIVKDSINKTMNLSVAQGNDTTYERIVVNPYAPYEGTDEDLPSDGLKTLFEFAPSDPNYVYAMGVDAEGSLEGVYLSTDAGENWRLVGPGGSNYFTPFSGTGSMAGTISVYPNNPDKVIIGGINLWMGEKLSETGYYDWKQKTQPSRKFLLNGERDDTYVQWMHHDYAIHGQNPDTVYIAHSGGVSVTYDGMASFNTLNKQYVSTQFTTVSHSGKGELIGGTVNNGVMLLEGGGSTGMSGGPIGPNPPAFAEYINGNGGYGIISHIRPEVVIFGYPQFNENFSTLYRSDDRGENMSPSFLVGAIDNLNATYTPMKMWESFNNEYSRDSVMFYAEDINYPADTTVLVPSGTDDYPFEYTLEEELTAGDSIKVQDPISSKLFIAIEDEVWMSPSMLDFTIIPDSLPSHWFKIAEIEGIPTCIQYSHDANHLFVGTEEGSLYRVSNIALAYNKARADVRESTCIISTSEIASWEDRKVTSITVDQENPAHVIATLGNYGYDNYVYRTTNAIDQEPEFTSIQSNLPKLPAYASLIVLNQTNTVLLGTEKGIYTTTNVESAEWTQENANMGEIPVMMIDQQTIQRPWLPGYPGVNNYGVIYIATYGRGLYESKQFIGIDDQEDEIVRNKLEDVNVYPNPVTGSQAKVGFALNKPGDVQIKIFDLNGRMVQTRDYSLSRSGEHEIDLNIGDLNQGAYIMMINTEETVKTSKFVKMR
ncbi:MAG: T9SS type A sorting domain-containing protein [Bacteroidales bacterium]|nr:T9SS type A sorting domain-containing protein [Bacteroidales bacterium]